MWVLLTGTQERMRIRLQAMQYQRCKISIYENYFNFLPNHNIHKSIVLFREYSPVRVKRAFVHYTTCYMTIVITRFSSRIIVKYVAINYSRENIWNLTIIH